MGGSTGATPATKEAMSSFSSADHGIESPICTLLTTQVTNGERTCAFVKSFAAVRRLGNAMKR